MIYNETGIDISLTAAHHHKFHHQNKKTTTANRLLVCLSLCFCWPQQSQHLAEINCPVLPTFLAKHLMD